MLLEHQYLVLLLVIVVAVAPPEVSVALETKTDSAVAPCDASWMDLEMEIYCAMDS